MTTTLDAATLGELERLERAATPLFVMPSAWAERNAHNVFHRDHMGRLVATFCGDNSKADAVAYIAMRNALPALIATAREAQDTAQPAPQDNPETVCREWLRWGSPSALAMHDEEYWCRDEYGDVYRCLAQVHDSESVGFIICTPNGSEEEIVPEWIMPVAAFRFPAPNGCACREDAP